jgi:hypothetical protein
MADQCKSTQSHRILQSSHEIPPQINRDSLASYLGHFDQLSYFAIAENESKARIRFHLMEKIIMPCGAPEKIENEIP